MDLKIASLVTSCALISASLLVSAGAAAQATLKASASTDEASASSAADASGTGRAGERGNEPWFTRWAPEGGTGEFGIFAGVFLPENDLELFEADLAKPALGRLAFEGVNPEFGLRAGYYPLAFLGLEAEGALSPASTVVGGQSALFWAARAHALLQVPSWRITPFAVLGLGVVGVQSGAAAVGNDVDGTVQFGVGAKAYLGRYFALRLDIRDNLVRDDLGATASETQAWEVLLGASFVVGRRPRVDTDGDGFWDDEDACVADVGVAPDGCPVLDADGDGVLDADDACPQEPGVATDDRATNGCPPPPPVPDRDGDGVPDATDACPDIAAKTADGCPPDTDGDGFRDDLDKCPNEAETANAYLDDDGCPDEIPKAVSDFTGVIKGITFVINKATIQKQSTPSLDNAVKVMTEYPTLRVEISGHTDDKGTAERNQVLSGERADAVKKYLVDHGVDTARIETRGAGPAEPIADNKTSKGRASNRRIEFKLLK